MLAYEVNEMPPLGLIFSPAYMKHIKKYIRTKITQFLPRVPGVVKYISCEHVSQNVFCILKTVACIS